MTYKIMQRAAAPDLMAARLRIGLCYLWRFGRLPDLVAPTRFTELVQLRKLHDRNPAMMDRTDKCAAKTVVANTLGKEWLTPTLGTWSKLPEKRLSYGTAAMFKARSGCNQYAVLQGGATAQQWSDLRRKADRWTRAPYGFWLDEWAYRDAPRGVLAEPLLGDGGRLPDDYKVYVFNGVATHIQVHCDRDSSHRWVLYDRSGARMSRRPTIGPALPRSLPDMLRAAERLAAPFHFARVDFYEIAGRPRFGEFCFYPGSGLDRFEEDWIDVELGNLWRAALAVA